MLNEPPRGYIELPSLHGYDYNTDLHLGAIRTSLPPSRPGILSDSPLPASAVQSLALGAGHTVSVPFYTRSFPMPTRHTSHVSINEARKNVWCADGPTRGACVWVEHGVWAWDRVKDEPVVLRENYFVRDPASRRKVNSCMLQWWRRSDWERDVDRLVYRFLLPLPAALGRARPRLRHR
jgi:hypothetical protein